MQGKAWMLPLIAAFVVPFAVLHPASAADDITIDTWTADPLAWCEIQARWYADVLARVAAEPETEWIELTLTTSDAELAALGLPSSGFIREHTFETPTLVKPDGTMIAVDLPEAAVAGAPLASFGGSSCIGIRPGAWLLLPDEINGVPVPGPVATPTDYHYIQWCTAGHVFGSPGSYDLSTAGHCGRTGDRAVAIAAVGNHGGTLSPILLDIGRFGTSHNGGPGNDWALIDIAPQNQALTTPTMCFWGGPQGVFTKVGSTLAVTYRRNNLLEPQPQTSTDPLLVQGLVHYGHGTAQGATGTPRAHVDYAWPTTMFVFFGSITGGDSGSAANALGGDTLGNTREAAGVITHLWAKHLIDGQGLMGGTRATQITGTVANGQMVPYPAPIPIGP